MSKLSREACIIPSGLFLEGGPLSGVEHKSFGGFAECYRAKRDGKFVALKTYKPLTRCWGKGDSQSEQHNNPCHL